MTLSQDLQRTFTGEIPKYYDNILGPAWFGPIAADLARRVPMDPGGDVLEIACGTGLMTKPLRERLAPHRQLVATDLAPAMLHYARTKLGEMGGIEWQEADAARLPFPDERFGAVACSLGVMFLPDRADFFREARRVLRPGGTLHFNVWDRKELNDCVRIYSQVLQEMFPGDAEVDFQLPYTMADEGLLRRLLDEGGFEDARIEKPRMRIEGVAPLDIATGQVRGTPRGLLLAKRGVDFDVVIQKVTAALEAHCGRPPNFKAYIQVLAASARRPR